MRNRTMDNTYIICITVNNFSCHLIIYITTKNNIKILKSYGIKISTLKYSTVIIRYREAEVSTCRDISRYYRSLSFNTRGCLIVEFNKILCLPVSSKLIYRLLYLSIHYEQTTVEYRLWGIILKSSIIIQISDCITKMPLFFLYDVFPSCVLTIYRHDLNI